ncbi:heavy metal-associated isoprenylated plant protein 22-like [Gossypium australe]|uniref:Heavy metal-associated isoprenylated plant protein 22-like n=1 Tax=Gossypium australe TaxID=47621 RepID=A0A5B6UCS9_9ROSI|nr:heavy metal-associated isoprenylated plant protein 22-like [Gossypium australe]
MTMVEMRVHMDCKGCVAKIRKALGKLEGVDSIEIDMENQKVSVMGWAASDHMKVLKTVRKTGRRAELWPYPFNPQNQFYYEYCQTDSKGPPWPSSYNYYRHGYDGHDHGYYQPPPYETLISERASSIFSDENPNACSIM